VSCDPVLESSAPHGANVVGTRQPRSDAVAKVCGRAAYVADLAFPDALEAAILRSPHPFARIRRIDVSRAASLPGVAAVVYAGNTPAKPLDFAIKDQHLFARTYARYAGDPLAAVAAQTRRQAEAALAAIEVDYDVLTPVLSIDEALAPGAPLVHPDWRTYERSAGRVLRGNVCGYNRIRRGNVRRALERAWAVVESRFSFSPGIPGYLEPRAAVARREPDGGLTVWCGSQSPYGNREELAAFFDLPVEKVRFVNQFVGGAFGGKILLAAEWYAAALALQCDRPVRLVFSRHEDSLHVFHRHGGRALIRSGVARDGSLTAMQASFLFDGGAYSGYGNGAALIATMLVSAPYRIPNLDLEATLVYTNKQIAGPVRAPGGPQATFAKEVHIDEIAARVGMDPLAFRLQNMWDQEDVSPTGQRLTGVSAKRVLQAAAEGIGWGTPCRPKRGRGIACSWWFSSCGRSEARVEVRADGSIHVTSGNPEVGTGAATGSLPIIVAEHLGISPSAVVLHLADTSDATYDGGVGGSASTFSAGWAVLAAARDVREQLLSVAEEALEARRDDITIREGRLFVRGSPEHGISLGEAAALAGGIVGATGQTPQIDDPDIEHPARLEHHEFAAWLAPSYTASAAQVEVDPDTGRVTVERIVTAQDVGTAIDPAGIEGQIEGGAVQALGFALTEELHFGPHGIINTGLGDYLMPTIADAPDIQSVIIASPSREGPLGAKGAGEPPVTTPGAAIGNAVYHATGYAPHDVPLTPERVWRQLARSQS
jgi:CO/xanthine dehydrogenase Mo-binding subunit